MTILAPVATEAGWRRMIAVATTPPYSWFLLGEIADTISVWMGRLALGWLVWELTRSPAWLGILSFIKFAPTIVLGLVGGVLADRMSRRTLVIAVQAAAVAKSVAILALLATGALGLPMLIAIEFSIGTAIALSQAASKTIITRMVSEDRLSAAIALDSVVFNVAAMIGPAIAGAIMLGFDLLTCFAAIAVLQAINLAVLAAVVPGDLASRATPGESMLQSINAAMRYALHHPAIGPLLLLHLAFTLCVRPLVDMLPAFAGGVLGEGVHAVSLLTSALGAGAIASGLWLASRRSHAGLCRIVLHGMLWLGVAMIGFAAAPTIAVAAPIAIVIGVGMTVRGAGIQTLIQIAATDHLRGRVLSFYGLVLNGGAALGAAAMGGLAEWLGLRLAIEAMALASLAIWAAIMTRRRAMEAALEPDAPKIA